MAWPLIERSSPALFEGEWMLIRCLMPWARLWLIFVHSYLPFVRLCMVPHLVLDAPLEARPGSSACAGVGSRHTREANAKALQSQMRHHT